MAQKSRLKLGHLIYQSILVLIVVIVSLWLAIHGYDYYQTPLEERFYHPEHEWFKASGLFGHGLGVIGTLLICIGVFGYIPAKKYGFLEKYIRLRYLLEFHIFLCTLGPVLILFHTTFKFGGVVSIAFWSMVLVVLSGVVGRYIYLQIPRSISGRELSKQEIIETQKEHLKGLNLLKEQAPELYLQISNFNKGEEAQWQGRSAFKKQFKQLKKNLAVSSLSRKEQKSLLADFKNEQVLQRKIERLEYMQKLFKYWHVAHRPFALIMLIVLILHIVVTMGMGYTWIF